MATKLFPQDHELPQQEPGDGEALYRVAETVAGLVPAGVGTLLFRQLVQSPLERRMGEWREEVGASLRELEARKGVDLAALGEDQQFLDAVFAASQAAMKTSRAEKIAALRNAAINAALPDTRPDETLQHLFIGLIDRFTPWHLRFLKLIQNPTEYLRAANLRYEGHIAGSLDALIQLAFPELHGQRETYDQIWADIHASGLTGTPGLHTMMTPNGVMQKRTTPLADAFLRFIESPIEP